jgi:hypothetical protein
MTDLTPEDAATLLELPRSDRVSRLFDFAPFPYQADVLDSDPPRKLWVCGRQVGKTETASVVPPDYALMNPGEDVLIASRYQETADELFRRSKAHLSSMGPLKEIGVESPRKKTYELDTGARIMSRTLGTSGDQQRGKVPSCIVIEEGALVDREVYEQVLRPMFATHDDYELWLVTTPRGKQGYVWDAWKAPDSDQWARFHNKTEDNPLVSDEWLEEERASVDDITWRQEYLGEFVEVGDSWLPYTVVEPCVADEAPQRTGDRAWLGVDVARTGTDRSVYISVDSDGNVFDVVAIDTETLDQAVGRIKALHDVHSYSRILVDENGLGAGVADFSAVSLPNVEPVTFSDKSKQELYTELKRVLESRELSLPANDTLVSELTDLSYDFTSTGILRVRAASGRDDHADALALAVRGWQQQANQPRRVVRRGTSLGGGDNSDSSRVRRRSPGISVHNPTHGSREDKSERERKKREWWWRSDR